MACVNVVLLYNRLWCLSLCVCVCLARSASPRHEAPLRRPDGQHVPGEDHQRGQAQRGLQPGSSEPRQGEKKKKSTRKNPIKTTIPTTFSTLPLGASPAAARWLNSESGLPWNMGTRAGDMGQDIGSDGGQEVAVSWMGLGPQCPFCWRAPRRLPGEPL